MTNQPKKCPEYRPSINNGYPCLNCAKPREDHTGLATPVESRLGECSIHEDEHFKNERCRDFTLTRATSAAEQLRDAKEVIPPTPQPEPTAERPKITNTNGNHKKELDLVRRQLKGAYQLGRLAMLNGLEYNDAVVGGLDENIYEAIRTERRAAIEFFADGLKLRLIHAPMKSDIALEQIDAALKEAK